jgi:outer membrane protein assembly factor BamD
MKFKVFISSLLLITLGLTACKTSFEKVRVSNDPALIYSTADKYFEEGKWLKAQSLYEIVIPFYRGKQEGEKLFYNYAYTHYNLGDYILSHHYFKSFATTFYTSEFKEDASFMAAYSNYQLSPNFRLDQSYSDKAIDDFQLFVNTFPNSERVDECNTLIDELRAKKEAKAFDECILYYNLKQYQAAITSFDNMLKDYPETKKAEEIRYIILLSHFNLAKNSIFEKKLDRYNETLALIDKFLKKYPKSEYRKDIRNLKKETEKAIKIIV